MDSGRMVARPALYSIEQVRIWRVCSRFVPAPVRYSPLGRLPIGITPVSSCLHDTISPLDRIVRATLALLPPALAACVKRILPEWTLPEKVVVKKQKKDHGPRSGTGDGGAQEAPREEEDDEPTDTAVDWLARRYRGLVKCMRHDELLPPAPDAEVSDRIPPAQPVILPPRQPIHSQPQAWSVGRPWLRVSTSSIVEARV